MGRLKLKTDSELKKLEEYILRFYNTTYEGSDINVVKLYLSSAVSNIHSARLKLNYNSLKIKHQNGNELKNNDLLCPNTDIEITYGLIGWRKILVPIVRIFVSRIGSVEDLKNFDRDPVVFMLSLKGAKYKLIRKILFPI